MSGKGDARRPIDENEYRDNYDKIFGKKNKRKVKVDEEPFHIRNAKHLIDVKLKWEEKQKNKRDSKEES